MNKYPNNGCLVITGFILCGLIALVCTRPGSRGYLDSAYEKDYEWQGIEVGSILRLPIGSILPTGRKMAVVAFPTNSMEDARVVYECRGGEVPTRPVFVSATNSTVTYKLTSTQGKVTIDLAKLAERPLRSDTSPTPILESATPPRTESRPNE
jgi:hypothetical protein